MTFPDFELESISVDAQSRPLLPGEVERILRRERVFASCPLVCEPDAVSVAIAITADDRVLTVDQHGRVGATLAAAELRQRFEDAGLTLWLRHPLSETWDEEYVDETDTDLDSEAEPDDVADNHTDDNGADSDVDDSENQLLFAEQLVSIAEYSSRGRAEARIIAQWQGVEVAYGESGDWSVYRYQAADAVSALRDLTGIMVMVQTTPEGESVVRVRSPRDHYDDWFWPNHGRLLSPLIPRDELDEDGRALCDHAFTMSALAELAMLPDRAIADAEQAKRALLPEAFGGVIGADERIAQFVMAFGVPEELVRSTGGAAETYRPRGWASLVSDTLLAGTEGTLRPTQRDRRYGRLVRYLHARPGLRAGISVLELLAGAALIGGRLQGRRASGCLRGRRASAGLPGRRVIGAGLVVDALLDLVILGARRVKTDANPPASA